MAVIFKNPVVEIAKYTDGVLGDFETIKNEDIVKDSAVITPTLGSFEGYENADGDYVAGHTPKTKYVASFKTFKQISTIEDVDGVVSDEYAIRMSETKEHTGYVIDRCMLQAGTGIESSGEGTTYTFNAMKPTSGNTLKPYTKTTETQTESQGESQGE